MIKDAQSCNPETNVAEAAMLMWHNDCGVLPVINDNGVVLGIVTDRDICMAVAKKDRPASGIAVKEVVGGDLYSVRPDDDVQEALKIMRDKRVRRLPVVSGNNVLQGIISIDDIIVHLVEAKTPDLPAQDVLKTIAAFCGHRPLPSGRP
jgi:CBS domain-containing protein